MSETVPFQEALQCELARLETRTIMDGMRAAKMALRQRPTPNRREHARLKREARAAQEAAEKKARASARAAILTRMVEAERAAREQRTMIHNITRKPLPSALRHKEPM